MNLSRHQLRPEEKRKKVSIVGFEQGLIKTAPMDDPSYEIWGLNHANRLGFMVDWAGHFRADRWFDLHEEKAQSAEDLAWINTCPVPIYLTHQYGSNPNAIVFPLQEIIDFFKTDYFCSSFAYMLALAAYEGFEEIRLDGINLGYGRERLVERGNLEYWIGLLQGQGYQIRLPEGCQLCTHPYRYGFDYTEEKEAVEHIMATSVQECLNDQAVNKLIGSVGDEVREVLASIKDLRKHYHPINNPTGIGA